MDDILEKLAIWPTLPDAERELEAIRCRAEIGFVPYRLWASLTTDARMRLATLSQTDARKRLVDEAALVDMLRSKP